MRIAGYRDDEHDGFAGQGLRELSSDVKQLLRRRRHLHSHRRRLGRQLQSHHRQGNHRHRLRLMRRDSETSHLYETNDLRSRWQPSFRGDQRAYRRSRG